MWNLTNSERLINKIENIKTSWINTSQPSNPTVGSIYYDQNDWVTKIYDGTTWKELWWWWGWWGWWYICTYDNQNNTANTTWPPNASLAIVSTYQTTSPWSQRWWTAVTVARDQIWPRNSITCWNSVYTTVNNDWTCICAYSNCANTQIAFFTKANQWDWKVAYVDILTVWWWAWSYSQCWWSWWWVYEMTKMPIYTQWPSPISVWKWWTATSGCCAWWQTSALWITTWWWTIQCSWTPLDKQRWTSCTLKKTEWCYSITNYWWAWWVSGWQNGNCNWRCVWCAWYNSDKCDLVVDWALPWWWYTSRITWQERTYWWWWWNGYSCCWCFYPWNYWWASDKVLVLPSCWGWAWWNWYWSNQYVFRVNWYNWCSSCVMPDCCFTYNDVWNHCCDATYYWWWWWWWWWKWCQWVAIIRYPTDWSYWLSNNTLWWTVTTEVIDWKEYRIHTFTDTDHVCCFYPVFK